MIPIQIGRLSHGIAGLLARHHHVVAIDLLGMGKSDKPMIDDTMNTWTEFIAEFMRLKSIDRATVAGSVMGGALAVQFTLDDPALSRGMIAAASNSGPKKREVTINASDAASTSLTAMRRSLLRSFYQPVLAAAKTLYSEAVARGEVAGALRGDVFRQFVCRASSGARARIR